MEMVVERAEIVEMGSKQVGLVESLSVLVFATAKRGAEAVPGVCWRDMMTSLIFCCWRLGLLVCALVPVEMLSLGAGLALLVGAIVAIISAARNCRAESEWVAQTVGLPVLVQNWLGVEYEVVECRTGSEQVVMSCGPLLGPWNPPPD
jgi:hypothetical protein